MQIDTCYIKQLLTSLISLLHRTITPNNHFIIITGNSNLNSKHLYFVILNKCSIIYYYYNLTKYLYLENVKHPIETDNYCEMIGSALDRRE